MRSQWGRPKGGIETSHILLLIVDVQRIDLAAHHAGRGDLEWREKPADSHGSCAGDEMRSVLPPIAALAHDRQALRASRISVFRVGFLELLSPSSIACPGVSMAGSSEDNRAWEVQSEDAKRLLAEDKYDDCLSCRVTGELGLCAP